MTLTPLPIKWEEVSAEEKATLKRLYPVEWMQDMIRFEGGCLMPRKFIEETPEGSIADRLYNFAVKKDDIWIVTFPKTGTTWTQETVSMLVNNVDKEKGKVPLLVRSPFLEMGCIGAADGFANGAQIPEFVINAMRNPMGLAESLQGRRVLKSHLPMQFLPPDLVKKCKVVYVARNPKDTCVSFFNHNRDMPGHGFSGDFADFATQFKAGLQLYGDYWLEVNGYYKHII